MPSSACLRLIAFFSVFIAVLVTMISVGVTDPGQGTKLYSLWPKNDLPFHKAFLSVSNIVFAYGKLSNTIISWKITNHIL
jgi:hypothetical protein